MRRQRHNFFNKRAAHFVDADWSRRGELRKSNTFHKTRILTNSFFQIPQILSSSWHDVIHVPGPIYSLGFLLWHRWLSHPPRARVNTCAQCVHLTNPCTKWNVLSLTKPKGKIYKTKSFGNYITMVHYLVGLYNLYENRSVLMTLLVSPFPSFRLENLQ